MTWHYIIQTPLDGGGWFDVCRCLTPESAAQIVEALISTGTGRPSQVLVVLVPA